MVGMAKTKTPKGYSVRPATNDDLKAIVGIYNWAVNQTFATIDSEPLDAEEAQAWWEMHGKRSLLLVSVDETGVIGWARLLPWKQRGYDVVECLVYVDPVHHGTGIGGALLSELIKEARGLGSLTIVASIATDNRAGLGGGPQGRRGRGLVRVGGWKDHLHDPDRLPLPDHRGRAGVLAFVQRAGPGELHPAAVDHVANRNVDLRGGCPNRFG